MQIGTLLANLAKKSGIDATDPKLAAALSIQSEIPDEFANKIETELLTVEAAKSHNDVYSHIKGKELTQYETAVKKLLDGLGLDDDAKALITGEQKSGAKFQIIQDKINELIAAKVQAPKGEKAELQKEIEKLQADLRTVKESETKQIEALNATHAEELKNERLYNLLSTKTYVFPKEMPIHLQVETARNTVNAALATKGFKIISENGQPKLVKLDGSKPFDEKHVEMQLQPFIDGTLAANGLLLVNKPAEPPKSGAAVPPIIPGGSSQLNNSDFASLLDTQLTEAVGAYGR
jgi:hypothetical protein